MLHTATGGGTDYTLASDTLNFDPSNSSRSVPLSIVNDALNEANETVIITLSGAPGGSTIGSPSVFTYTITENDISPYRYVRENIATPGNGRSWSTAYKYLRDALNEATDNPGIILEVRVAAGSYRPDQGGWGRRSTTGTRDSLRLRAFRSKGVPGKRRRRGVEGSGGERDRVNGRYRCYRG